MSDEMDREAARTAVCCVEEPIVANAQFEHASPLPSPEWFWRDLVEMSSEPPDPVENTLPDVRCEASEIVDCFRTEFDVVGAAHHLSPYLLATSAAGTPRSPRRVACTLWRSRRSIVDRRVRPLSGSLNISVNFRSTASSTTSRSSSTVIRVRVFIGSRPPANRLAFTTLATAAALHLGASRHTSLSLSGSITHGFFPRQGQTPPFRPSH